MKLDAFLAKWRDSEGSERSNSQHFLIDLCDLLGLPRPGTSASAPFRFEKDVAMQAEDGAHQGRVDLHRTGMFVLESKQFSRKVRATNAWERGMQNALGQALGYARTLAEPPVLVIACDVGYCFEILASFDRSGLWRPFPDPSTNRIYLEQLTDPKLFERLKLAFSDPASLDPSRRQVQITKEVAEEIAKLAPALREAGHTQKAVASFLIRCLFTMFAEDVGLFEGKKKVFEHYLREFWIKSPKSFPGGVSVLWQTMDTGGHLLTGEKVHPFNGGLFKDHSALPLTEEQLEILLRAAERDWSEVEPAIFGTLLENALDAKERHSLGAHFTPRAYVERLVRPTIEEPLRAEWDDVQFRVRTHLDDQVGKPDPKAALFELTKFHARLCKIRVLDPACGTGNFLYVAMDLMKQLEREVLEEIARVGGKDQQRLELASVTITPEQFRGIEKNAWAKEIAEVVLWIGYLRLQWKLRESAAIALGSEPILTDYGNIECRDAILDWDGAPNAEPKKDEKGKIVTRWDGQKTKVDPITGRDVPDPIGTVVVYEYPNPQKARWPAADFIVGNPPFVGNKRMRLALGDGYAEALRAAYDDVPESADLVMYWWHEAAERVRAGKVRRFGLITTNSITQAAARTLVAHQLAGGLGLAFAIGDHPWVDTASGAAVRIAMTVGAAAGVEGRLGHIASERPGSEGASDVELQFRAGKLGAALTIGGSVSDVVSLASNADIAFMGVTTVGDGFRLDAADHSRFDGEPHVRPFITGRDLVQRPEAEWVIDTYGLSLDALQREAPRAYQHLLTTVRPDRWAKRGRTEDADRYADEWWLFAKSRPAMRAALVGLAWFIGTPETSRHRVFVRLDASAVADHSIYAIALSDWFFAGVLSARVHRVWSLHAGGTLEDRPRYRSPCFDPFPFPSATDAQKARIRELGERLDAHRKRQLAAYPKLTITGMYNVLEKLRSGEALTAKDKVVHEEGLVSILKEIHDQLDVAVFEAYGWDPAMTDEQLLEKLVALNAERAAEEKRGVIRWLRPEYQIPLAKQAKPAKPAKTEPRTELVQKPLFPVAETVEAETDTEIASSPPPAMPAAAAVWPPGYFARYDAVRDLLATLSESARFEATDIDAMFKGKAKNRVADITRILQTMAGQGRVVILAPGQYGRAVRRIA